MRNINIFRTDVKDHIIPRHILLQAMRLSPGADWTDRETQAYSYLKRWALNQEGRMPEVMPEEVWMRKEEIPMVTLWNDRQLPEEIVEQAKKLSPGKKWLTDHRTKGYKLIEAWVSEQDNKHGHRDNDKKG